jgi:hypothetical protein
MGGFCSHHRAAARLLMGHLHDLQGAHCGAFARELEGPAGRPSSRSSVASEDHDWRRPTTPTWSVSGDLTRIEVPLPDGADARALHRTCPDPPPEALRSFLAQLPERVQPSAHRAAGKGKHLESTPRRRLVHAQRAVGAVRRLHDRAADPVVKRPRAGCSRRELAASETHERRPPGAPARSRVPATRPGSRSCRGGQPVRGRTGRPRAVYCDGGGFVSGTPARS